MPVEFPVTPPPLLLLKQVSMIRLDVPSHMNGVVNVKVTENGAVPDRVKFEGLKTSVVPVSRVVVNTVLAVFFIAMVKPLKV
jgi:hypothetical protein